MPTWVWIALGFTVGATLLLAFALGGAAARGDRLSEEALARLREEDEGGC